MSTVFVMMLMLMLMMMILFPRGVAREHDSLLWRTRSNHAVGNLETSSMKPNSPFLIVHFLHKLRLCRGGLIPHDDH